MRVIAATNRDLAAAVRLGTFRQDLFYRLNVFPIRVPPLRERTEDIPLLAHAFSNEFATRFGQNLKTVSPRTMEELKRYSWPGNIRELRNIIERAAIISSGDTLDLELPRALTDQDSFSTLAQAETEHIRAALKRSRGRIKGTGGAASILGMKPSTLYTRMKKLGISPKEGRQ